MVNRLLSAAMLLAFAVVATASLAGPASALTLTNLKGPVARICKVAQARSIAELWRQINACNVAVASSAPPPAPAALPTTFTIPLEKALQPAWGSGLIPGIYNVYEGAFRFTCKGDGPISNDDPVDYAGQPGAAHLHLVWGNRSFDAFTNAASLAASASTNCNNTPFSTNRSSYWMPALIHDDGKVIRPNWISVYYKRKTARSPYCTPGDALFIGKCAPLPDDIRFIWGWNRLKPAARVEGAFWYCTGGHYPDLEAVFANGCKVGDTLVANTIAPNCWDGRLDSPDHRSHVVFARYDDYGRLKCPATHPSFIPQEENKATWTVTADMIGPGGKPRIRLSSDHMLPGAKPGQTLHADYIEKWEPRVKRIWHDHCIEKGLNCSGGDLGNGQQLIGA